MKFLAALGMTLLLVLPATSQAETVLRRGNSVEPETLDPHQARGVSASNILRDLYEGLTTESPTGEIVPGAAERWEVSADGRTWTFHLRADGRWSNGDPLTAASFEDSLKLALNPATGSGVAQLLACIENAVEIRSGRVEPAALGVKALDPYTLQIRVRAATPQLPALLSHPLAYPIHDYQPSGRKPVVGNGAYVLESWVPNAQVTLVRNPNYWDRANVAVDRVLYYPTENPASELKRYRAGELDVTDTIPVSQARWIRAHFGEELHVAPYLGVYYYGFNLLRAPFKDQPALRKALALAVDRETLAGKVLATGELPAYSWVPPGIAGYTPQVPEWASWPAERRLAEARRLYAEAGYSDEHPLEVELRYNTGDNHKRVALSVAWMWQQALGVRTRLVNEEYKVYLQNRRARLKTELFRADWIGDYPDAATFAERMSQASGLNDTGYASPEYEALLASAAAQSDAATRNALLEQAERVLLEDPPVVPLYFYVSKHLVKPWVQGWSPNIMDHHYSKHVRVLPH